MNALLEGDVARVGVVGIGARARAAPGAQAHPRRATSSSPPAACCTPSTPSSTRRAGLDRRAVDAALDGLAGRRLHGARRQRRVRRRRAGARAARRRARARARPAGVRRPRADRRLRAGDAHGQRGDQRVDPAAGRAHRAGRRARAATRRGIDVPLLVLRGDGGAMSLEAFRRAPSFTIGSGPGRRRRRRAAPARARPTGSCSSAAAPARTCRVVKGGRTVLRTLRVMGRPTSIRSVDSWVVGAAGGSMARLGRRRIEEAGPRSAHVAGLPYACFADAGRRSTAPSSSCVAPRAGRPARVRGAARAARPAASRSPRPAPRTRSALVDGAAHAARSRARRWPASPRSRARLRRTPRAGGPRAARRAPSTRSPSAVAEAARTHDFGPDVPVVALGGAGTALARRGRRARLGRPRAAPEHPEILSLDRRGAVARARRGRPPRRRPGGDALALAREAERACVDGRRGAADGARRDALRGARRPAARGRDRRRRARVRRRRAASRSTSAAQLRAAAARARDARGGLQRRRPQRLLPRVLRERLGRAWRSSTGSARSPLAENAKRVIADDGGRAARRRCARRSTTAR